MVEITDFIEGGRGKNRGQTGRSLIPENRRLAHPPTE